MHRVSPVMLVVHGGSAAMNPGADYVQPLAQSPLAPEQGAGPVTANFSIKLRLLEKPTVPVSTGIFFYISPLSCAMFIYCSMVLAGVSYFFDSSFSIRIIASNSHRVTHRPHPIHRARLIFAFVFSIVIAFIWHISVQISQPVQSSSLVVA